MTTKRCFKCLCDKPLEDFYKHSAMGDGRLGKCKECTKADVRKNRTEKIAHYRAFDKARASQPHRVAARAAYSKTPAYAESHAASAKRWANRHPERRKASHIVSNAVRDGKIIPWPVCAVPECCGKPQAHHPDYSRPLDVVWLCVKHHKEAHALVKQVA